MENKKDVKITCDSESASSELLDFSEQTINDIDIKNTIKRLERFQEMCSRIAFLESLKEKYEDLLYDYYKNENGSKIIKEVEKGLRKI